ncbi:MAG: twin-arginine translocation signal domain-containing protein [Microgenomates group bacterium]
MRNLNRRDFLKLAGLATAAAVLTECAPIVAQPVNITRKNADLLGAYADAAKKNLDVIKNFCAKKYPNYVEGSERMMQAQVDDETIAYGFCQVSDGDGKSHYEVANYQVGSDYYPIGETLIVGEEAGKTVYGYRTIDRATGNLVQVPIWEFDELGQAIVFSHDKSVVLGSGEANTWRSEMEDMVQYSAGPLIPQNRETPTQPAQQETTKTPTKLVISPEMYAETGIPVDSKIVGSIVYDNQGRILGNFDTEGKLHNRFENNLFDKFTGLKSYEVADVLKQAMWIHSPIEEHELWKDDMKRIDAEFQKYLERVGKENIGPRFNGDGDRGNGYYRLATSDVQPVAITTFEYNGTSVPVYLFPAENKDGLHLLRAAQDLKTFPLNNRGIIYDMMNGSVSITVMCDQTSVDAAKKRNPEADYTISQAIIDSQPGYYIEWDKLDEYMVILLGVAGK